MHMRCFKCNLHIKRLTRFRSLLKEFCQCSNYEHEKYHFKRIKVNQIVIYPWNDKDKCYNPIYMRKLREAVYRYIKKHGGQFYVRRHLAGIEITRLA